ncbi:hypothetical protein BDZ97DRAFT_1809130 [Flammula alnicola]|nr:hypothetical protein BDZ97DRAFT_1809130 [Flammula alnicola]
MIIEPSTPSGIPSSRMSEKVVDNPPAYSDLESAHGRVRHHPPPPVHASIARNNGQSLTVPPPSVDQVHIFERKHNIEGEILSLVMSVQTAGTFYIDPLVPALDQSRRGKQKCNKPLPHASFRTRNGTIDLNLATTGDGQKTPKARITVSSRHGLIRLNLVCPSRHLLQSILCLLEILSFPCPRRRLVWA